jgi:hypothetical protein
VAKQKNIVIFPCTDDKLKVKYHYYVVSYFLSKYLKGNFNIIRTRGAGRKKRSARKEAFLKKASGNTGIQYQRDKFSTLSAEFSNFFDLDDSFFENVDYILTTTQRGFTKLQKRNTSAFKKIQRIKKKYPNIKLVAAHDHSAPMRYYEDILLVALPFNETRRQKVKRGSNTDLIYTGWCADHQVFKDNPKKNGDLNIVLDHAALQDFRVDATKMYVNQIKKLKKNYPNKNINLCRIKKGFEFFNFDKNKWTYDLKLRWWNSQYDNNWNNGAGCCIFQIAECLNNSHIFCVTHVESCGLTGIEALMAGCKLYIPNGKDSFRIWGSKNMGSYEGPFLKQALLKPYMDYDIFDVNNPKRCFGLLKRDINNYNLKYKRKLLIKNNSWKSAANKAYKGVTR